MMLKNDAQNNEAEYAGAEDDMIREKRNEITPSKHLIKFSVSFNIVMQFYSGNY